MFTIKNVSSAWQRWWNRRCATSIYSTSKDRILVTPNRAVTVAPSERPSRLLYIHALA